MQTDIQTDMTRLIVTLRDFVDATTKKLHRIHF